MLLRGVAGPVAITGPGANRVGKLHDLEEGDWKITRIGYETLSKWRFDRTTQLTELFPARATRFFCDFEAVDCRNKTATFRSFRTRMQLELTLPTTTLLKTAAMERMVKNLMALGFGGVYRLECPRWVAQLENEDAKNFTTGRNLQVGWIDPSLHWRLQTWHIPLLFHTTNWLTDRPWFDIPKKEVTKFVWNIHPVSSERGTTNLSINLPHLAFIQCRIFSWLGKAS